MASDVAQASSLQDVNRDACVARSRQDACATPCGKSRNVRLTVEYDGTCYAGWQRQKGKPTVQEEIEKAIHALTGEWCHVQGAGRTDSGVHALDQTANVRLKLRLSPAKLVHALNAHLPPDISIVHAVVVDDGFHSQFDAVSKKYRYTILNRPGRSALERNRAYHVRQPLDVERMRTAAGFLAGRRDFRAFCSEARSKRDTVRRLETLEVEREDDFIFVTACADGFLYNMVRAIVGTLVLVGRGKVAPEEVGQILASRDRRKAGPNAPAKGLALVAVEYPGQHGLAEPQPKE